MPPPNGFTPEPAGAGPAPGKPLLNNPAPPAPEDTAVAPNAGVDDAREACIPVLPNRADAGVEDGSPRNDPPDAPPSIGGAADACPNPTPLLAGMPKGEADDAAGAAAEALKLNGADTAADDVAVPRPPDGNWMGLIAAFFAG